MHRLFFPPAGGRTTKQKAFFPFGPRHGPGGGLQSFSRAATGRFSLAHESSSLLGPRVRGASRRHRRAG